MIPASDTSSPVIAQNETSENNARPFNELGIHLGEHWGIVGSTGTGKTVFTLSGLLEYLRRQFPEVPRYVLDSTGDPDIPSLVFNPSIIEGNHVPDLLRSSQYTQVWTPHNSKMPLNYLNWFDQFNDSRTPSIIVLDEIASITGKALGGLETLFKQMRKHGGTVVACTQRMSKVDTDIFSQLTHYVQFFINNEDYDLRKARDYLHMSKEEQRMPRYEHGFFYRKTRGNTAYREYRDYREFFERQ